MRELINYHDIDPQTSKATAKKISNHLWYLVPETMTLSLLDDNVSTAIKANIAKIMLEADKGEEKDESNQMKRYILNENEFSAFTNIDFSSFVTPVAKQFF